MVDKERDEDAELLAFVFKKDPTEERIQEELALPVHEGNGTVNSRLSRVLYPYYFVKNYVRQQWIKRSIVKKLK